MRNRFFIISLFVALSAMAGVAFAQSSLPSGYGPAGQGGQRQSPPGVFGQVTAINGTTITITDSRNNTTYTIDASSAAVTKNGAASSIASIAVGDTIMVQGTTSGDSVTATSIMDGFGGGHGTYPGGHGSSTRPFNASGTPHFSGTRPTGTPSGTPPFASGTFPDYHGNFPSSTPSSTPSVTTNQGFFGSIAGFFANIFSFFKL
ncbi:MAG: DUF5666 domain-containing protein [Minisyncoccia bacterium]